MVLGAAAIAGGTAASGVSGLFGYNRDNFIYDRKMRQETEYKIMEFRIKQASLWREDVRDIIGLTAVKMDTYLVVNAVQLGFCVMAFCEGRLARGTPTWLIGCHTLSLAGAFMYLLMSIWLAMHATVTAKSYEVRLLTQLVRLPMPTWGQIEGARTYASSYEKVDSKQMFRVPFLQGTQARVLRKDAPRDDRSSPRSQSRIEGTATSDGGAETADLWGLEKRGDNIYELDGKLRSDPSNLRHLRLVQEAMQYWQSYDAFARAAMSMGTNQICSALSYYVLGYVLISNHAIVAAWLTVCLFMSVSIALIRMDMSLTSCEFYLAAILVSGGPCLTAVACEQWSRRTSEGVAMASFIMPFVYLCHGLWLTHLLYICRVSEQHGNVLLPTGFRSVLYLDVFGWIRKQGEHSGPRRFTTLFAGGATSGGGRGHSKGDLVRGKSFQEEEKLEPFDPSEISAGAGPAVHAVAYDANSRPIPVRPEELPGAAQETAPTEIRRSDFEPTTFVPREKQFSSAKEAEEEGCEDENDVAASRARPGFIPWRIFCAATTLLIALWMGMGVLVLYEVTGAKVLAIQPVLKEPEPGMAEPKDAKGSLSLLDMGSALSGGKLLKTEWTKAQIYAHGLSCTAAGDGAEVVANSRFGLYTAKVGSNAHESVKFKRMPPCDAVEGEALQDVAVRCNSNAVGCEALVLHQQGQRLTSCPLHTDGISFVSVDATSHGSSLIGTNWLGEALADGLPQEEVASIAIDANCSRGASGGQGCAYVETTQRRLVELQLGNAKGAWQPSRVLLEGMGREKALQGGALSTSNAGILFLLHPGQQKLEAIDLAHRGASVGKFRLPKDHMWSAVCAYGTGSNSSLLLLTDDASPQLWHFPFPESLLAGGVTAQEGGPRHGEFRQQRKSSATFLQVASDQHHET